MRTRKPLKVHPTPSLPASLPRDMNLHVLRKHAPALYFAVRKSTVRYMPRLNIIRATIDYDPDAYLRALERKR